MLNIGDTAPDFELTDENGEQVTLDDLLAGESLILYFYPADFTPLCTAEACSIRDMHDDIVDAGIKVVGISPQSERTHQRFKEQFNIPFPLLFDKNKKVIRAFGVDGPLGFGVRRATYLISKEKHIENRVVSDLFVGSHTQFIKEVIANHR
ncbi:MAG: peroxiredoxin [Gammaproteobacteria bacterium]|nr:peroxiredoxin [Gammaproteobacteria bacterium]